jgi:butyryl-CoA dehydrogenase
VPIVAHADVRRMLLAQKAWVEGGLALVLYCARLVDDVATGEDAALRERDRLLLELLTPIAKSWPSEFCLEANKLAIQVLGGYGYTRDYPVERLYRDNRLNHIHEGAYGIQGLDLLGRKAGLDGGAALRELGARIGQTIQRARSVPSLAWMAESLELALDESAATTQVLLEAAAAGRTEVALANATLYLEALGQLVVAWRWLEQAFSAATKMDAAPDQDRSFYRGKLAACRYFFRYELTRTTPTWRLLRDLDETTTAMAVEEF